MTDNGTAEKPLGEVVNDVSTKASLLIREEIELAKAEISEKVTSLAKGSGVAIAAGVCAVFALIYFWVAVALFINDLFNVHQAFWFGFVVVFGILMILTAIAGFIGIRWIKRGAPPTPDMAIEEAKRTRAQILEHN
jgi:ABC-type multidrug transport system permease subunit